MLRLCRRSLRGKKCCRKARRKQTQAESQMQTYNSITMTHNASYHPSCQGSVVFSISRASGIPLPSWLMSPLLLLLGWRCPALHSPLLRGRRLLVHVLLLTRTGALRRVHRSDSRNYCSLRVSSRPAGHTGHGLVICAAMHRSAALAVMELWLWLLLRLWLWMSLLCVR